MKLLIVEDETAMAEGLKFNFEQDGYEVEVASDGHTAIDFFPKDDPHATSPFDVIVLDLMLPEMSGYEICRHIREVDQQVPILVLSARTLSEDKTLAFDCGTDQYMTKPFVLQELLSRVRNLIDRRRPAAPPKPASHSEEHRFRLGEVQVDLQKFVVERGGERQALTTREVELLRYFKNHEGRVLSRAEILKDVWDEPTEIATRTIDNFVLRLRKFIEADPAQPRHILSVRGTGYRFVSEPEESSASDAPA